MRATWPGSIHSRPGQAACTLDIARIHLRELHPAPRQSRRASQRPLRQLAVSSQQRSQEQQRPSGGQPGIFPAGKRQARVKLPALFITVAADDFLASPSAASEDIAAAVAGGATAVLLREGLDAGAAQLYEAAVALKGVLRGRAALLVVDRTDVADAADADGAVLTPTGLPTVVARNMMQDGLALVGRAVANSEAAVAAAAEGASLLILQETGGSTPAGAAVAAAKAQRSGASVPVIAALSSGATAAELTSLVGAGVDGLALELGTVSAVAAVLTGQRQASLTEAASSIVAYLAPGLTSSSQGGPSPSGSPSPGQDGAAEAPAQPAVAQLSQLLSASREQMVLEEKEVLARVVAFLEHACPALEEVALLRDAVRALDELFLVVVVGEFNSGKSAVINALLGRRYLAEGILPTTNEISVLKWAEDGSERMEQTSDGLFVRHLPADLLREINIVDTPGTNVILERQQRLTEEYVPRADLVLFVMSADRPFTDSEVRFLKYIRQWGKKVVFVVNKADLLSSSDEVAEVVEFVAGNAAKLLGVEGAHVLPVSARVAAEAKLACREAEGDAGAGALTPAEQGRLAADPRWAASRFESLESFICEFLMGSGSSSGESVRLKLQTPLSVADALLDAAGRQLDQEAEVAAADAASVGLVRKQLAAFQAEMQREGLVQCAEVERKVAGMTKQAAAAIDATLQLSNWEVVAAYVLGPGAGGAGQLPVARRFNEGVADGAAAQLRAVVQEHGEWVRTNCRRQADNYRAFAAERVAALGRPLGGGADEALDTLESDPEARRRWRQVRTALATAEAAASPSSELAAAGDSTAALTAAAALDARTTGAMLEEEVRDAVLSTAGSAAGAGAFGVVMASVLPTKLEDFLALALSAAVGYASVLNLPLRRADAKKKVEAAAQALSQDVQGKMQAELQVALGRCEREVVALIEPLEELTAAEVARAERERAARQGLFDEVGALQSKVENVE